jgi:hypothetical protein
MDGKSMAIASRRRSILYIAVGNLLAALVFNPPVRAYEGIFEMIGQAVQSVSGQAQPEQTEGPIDDNGNLRTAVNLWQPYAPRSLATAAELARFTRLATGQSRESVSEVLGVPTEVNYSSVNGYELYRTENGQNLIIEYTWGKVRASVNRPARETYVMVGYTIS